MVFNEQLICLRKQKGLSQEQLGEEIGVTRQTVSKWELGETTPEMDKLILLSKLFSISIDELVGNTEEECSSNCMMQNNSNNGTWGGLRREYVSKKKVHGIPMVHISYGPGAKTAKGIIAIGNAAVGVVAMGYASVGVVSLGLASLGIISFGVIALGLLFAFGSFGIGFFAFGAVAIGYLAFGGAAIGVYAIGGSANALRIAAGGSASAPIAIGDVVNGETVFDVSGKIDPKDIEFAIISKYPNISKILVKIFSKFGGM